MVPDFERAFANEIAILMAVSTKTVFTTGAWTLRNLAQSRASMGSTPACDPARSYVASPGSSRGRIENATLPHIRSFYCSRASGGLRLKPRGIDLSLWLGA